MALCSFAVSRAMVGNGCMQHFGRESDTWGTGLLQVFLGTSVLGDTFSSLSNCFSSGQLLWPVFIYV